MKRLIMIFSVVLMTAGLQAQIKTPQPSPSQKIEQKVGLTDVTLEYSRPSMRGRTLYGNLVPYGKIWRTGANQNTKITISDDVEIGKTTLKAGTYAIFTKPASSTWDVYFYTDSNNWGAPEKWDDAKVAAKINVPATPITREVETFTMVFDDLTNNSATLAMLWGKTYVGIPITFSTDKIVSSNIERAMSGPTAGDYYSAAVYYFEADKDIKQSKEWMDKAMEMSKDPKYYQLRQKSLIYAKAGDKKGAIDAAKQSLEMAKAAGNEDYITMNTQSLKEWGAM